MSETQVLLAKVTALRQRLEQAQGLASEARSAAAALEQAVASGGEHDGRLDAAVRPLTGASALEPARPPRQITARARRVLERGGELLRRLRALADDFEEGPRQPDPLGQLYRDTVAQLDTALRTVGMLPESTTAQLHLCRGLEVTLDVIADRLRTLTAGTARQRREAGRIDHLADLLTALAEGQPVGALPFQNLAEEVLADAGECGPLRFLEEDAARPARFVACHSLTVAQVMARVIRHAAPDLRARPQEAVLAALLHDAGMLRVPAGILARPAELDEEQRRAVEAHCRAGAELVGPLLPEAPWLADAAALHHERLDGTGYPEGLPGDARLSPLIRLLAVCDVYSALCGARPHRPARATRTALADTLLLAEQGLLDADQAECLLHLSFYPVGSVVELAHGAVGVVVATPGTRHDLSTPARPVVAVLTDAQGEPLGCPHHLDLAQCDRYGIVRTLSGEESRHLLARRFPEWAA
jgi:HD-GYP domain-containing protein (c-di-GMP phosphodiesterase class II)